MGKCYLIKNGGIYLTPEELDDIRNFSWRANSSTENGYVPATDGAANKVYGTDESGNPGWIDYSGSVTLPDHIIIGEAVELPEVNVDINADLLQGFNADYFASKTDLQNYISIEKESTFATKTELQDFIPSSKEDTFATKLELQEYIPSTKESTFATKTDLDNFLSKNETEDLVTKEQLTERAEKPQFFRATIPIEGWSGEDIKTITVLVPDLKGSDAPIIDIILSGDNATRLNLLRAWALIFDIIANEGSITVEAVDVPDIEISINMMVMR